jgi:O-antigen ligase
VSFFSASNGQLRVLLIATSLLVAAISTFEISRRKEPLYMPFTWVLFLLLATATTAPSVYGREGWFLLGTFYGCVAASIGFRILYDTPAELQASLLTSMRLLICFAALGPALGFNLDPSAISGFFVAKNLMGYAASTSVVVLLVVGARDRKWIDFPLLIVGSWLIISSKSSGALVVTCGTLFIWWYLLRDGRDERGWAFKGSLLVVVLFLTFSYKDSLLPVIGKDPTFTGRLPLWAGVMWAIGENPLVGYGAFQQWIDRGSASPEYLVHIWTDFTKGWRAPHAHNGYLDLFMSFGLIGTVLIVTSVLSGIRRLARQDSGSSGPMILLLTHTMLYWNTESWLNRPFQMMIVLTVGLLAMTNVRSRLDSVSERPRDTNTSVDVRLNRDMGHSDGV